MTIGKPRDAQGFTLVELLVSISIIVVLAGILYLNLGPVRERARETNCINNLHQIGLALQIYRQDYGGEDPPGAVSLASAGLPCSPPDYALKGYGRTPEVFHCLSQYWPDEKDNKRTFPYMWMAVPDSMIVNAAPPPVESASGLHRLYSDVLAKRGLDAPYLADPHHGTLFRPEISPSFEYPFVLVLRISGQVQRERATTKNSFDW